MTSNYDVPVESCDPNEIIPRLNTLKPGQRVIYHIGNLGPDRMCKDLFIRSQINQCARTAMDLSDLEKVHLTQRRLLSPNGYPYYGYIATGVKKDAI